VCLNSTQSHFRQNYIFKYGFNIFSETARAQKMDVLKGKREVSADERAINTHILRFYALTESEQE